MEKDQFFEDFSPVQKQDWLQRAEKELKGTPLQKINLNTLDGLSFNPYATHEDWPNAKSNQALPGQFPFTRSSKVLSNGWIIRERINRTSLAKAKIAIDKAVSQGVHNIALDIKADDKSFEGIPINHLADLQNVLSQVDPTSCGISFNSGNVAPYYLKLLAEWAQKEGHDNNQLFGSLDFDPLGQLLQTGSLYNSQEKVHEDVLEYFSFAKEHLPHYKVLTIHSNTFHNSGAPVVSELAYTLALVHEYLHQLTDLGIKTEDFVKQVQVQLSVGTNYFTEIAKQRAFRMLWSTLIGQYTEIRDERIAPYILAQTSQWDKTVYDPFVNMLRSTTQGMAAAIAGADEIQLDAYDSSFKPANPFSERIARNIHHLMSGESYLDRTVDPAAGSYYIESMTQTLAQEAWEKFKKIEQQGGLLAEAKKGTIQRELLQIRKERETRLATLKDVFVGVNQYPNPKDKATDLISEGEENKAFDEAKPEDIDNAIADFAKEKLYPEHQFDSLEAYTATDSFDQARAMLEMMEKEGQKIPRVFLWKVGNKVHRSARGNFAKNLFACLGIEVIDNEGFKNEQGAFEAYEKDKSEIVIICSSDAEYKYLIPLATKKLKTYKPSLILATKPGDDCEDYEMMGIEDFIYAGMNVLTFLKSYFLEEEGFNAM